MNPPTSAPSPGTRLSKHVAELRACSRREAEQYIEGGWVRVDGQVVEEPQFRVLNQRIEIDPDASLLALTPVTLLWHKPAGSLYDTAADAPPPRELSQASHYALDRSGLRVLKRHLLKQAAQVPLESGASGLVVFTQDWRVARKLGEDAGVMEHEFMVEVQGEVSPDTLQRLNYAKGSQGQALPHFKASVNSAGAGVSRLRFAIRGVHLGLVAFLCERAGLRMLSMRRIRIGRVSLSDLPAGQWRYLMPHERF